MPKRKCGVPSTKIQNKRERSEMQMVTSCDRSENRLKQQIADRAMRAARREEYRIRERTDNTAKSALRRKDSIDRSKNEMRNRSNNCQFCREDPIGPSTIPVDYLQNNM